MLDLYRNIKNTRLQLNISQGELAKRVGYTDRSMIAKIESGSVDLAQSKIEAIAQALGTTSAYLMGWEDNSSATVPQYNNILPITTRKLPLLGNIACGKPIFADEEHEAYIEVGTDIQADFCLKAQGDSMIGARILDGDIVFIRQQSEVENGEIAAVIIDDSATLKRVYIYPDKLILNAENPKYEPLIYVGSELEDIRILGKAVAFQSKVK
jgi:repressor LexA